MVDFELDNMLQSAIDENKIMKIACKLTVMVAEAEWTVEERDNNNSRHRSRVGLTTTATPRKS